MPKVLIVGRPNVGKSSLFNALVGKKIAITADEPNTTRDILEQPIEEGSDIILADSGGMNFASSHMILRDVNERVKMHIAHADLILFVVEYDHTTNVDEEIIKILRKSGKKIFLVANKADNAKKVTESYAMFAFGINDLFPVSTSQRTGISELRSAVFAQLASERDEEQNDEDEETSSEVIKLVIAGRPNVGKSSLMNALLEHERVIVSDEAGTTRDSVDTPIVWKEKDFVLIDTAGLRKPGKIGQGNIESWSVLRTQASIERADICALLIDPVEGITQNDKNIIHFALEAQKGMILVVNKWDLYVERWGGDEVDLRTKFTAHLQDNLRFLTWAPLVFCSAKMGDNVKEVLDQAIGINLERHKRITTRIFNNFLTSAKLAHEPRGWRKSHNPKIYYGSQVGVNPPHFVIHVNNAEIFHFSWRRYLENKIRESFGFFGTPIVIDYRGRKDEDDEEDTPMPREEEAGL